VPPEYQESRFNSEEWPGIIFHGNRHFHSHTTPEFDAIVNRFDGEKRVLRALHILTGKRYNVYTLRGCCQSDWQTVYYPVEEYSPETLDILEIEYFNMGTEWAVDVDGCDVYVYAYSDTPEKIRAELAAAVGAKAEKIQLHTFTGWKRTAEYKEV
jgi:hypothetical protein